MPARLATLCSDFRQSVTQWIKAGLPCVWNTDLDHFINGLGGNRVKWVLVGDNPGEKERLDGRYFSCFGLAGTSARGVFRRHCPGVKNYCAQVMTLEKTPVYTPTTKQLAPYLSQQLFLDTQRYMAEMIYRVHLVAKPGTKVWITGYDWEIFWPFYVRMWDLYSSRPRLADRLYVSDHLSHSQFQKRLGPDVLEQLGLGRYLEQLSFRNQLLSWSPDDPLSNPWSRK